MLSIAEAERIVSEACAHLDRAADGAVAASRELAVVAGIVDWQSEAAGLFHDRVGERRAEAERLRSECADAAADLRAQVLLWGS